MDKIIELLKLLQDDQEISQRKICSKTGFSLGMVNNLLKSMTERELIKVQKASRKNNYELTDKGKKFLENLLREKELERMELSHEKDKKIQSAVILAAGENKAFDDPIGLLELDDHGLCIIDRIIENLKEFDINNIVVVIGYKYELYLEHFKGMGIHLVQNNDFKWTGTMKSLSLTKDFINDDFLLIDGDHLFEKRLISNIINCEYTNCLLLCNPSGNNNDTYVEFDVNGNVYKISKNFHRLKKFDACMSGIQKISKELFEKMLKEFDQCSNSLMSYEYVIEDLARIFKIPTLYLDDMVCLNINDQTQYEFAKNMLYSKVLKREKEFDHEMIAKIFLNIMNLKMSDIVSLEYAGGMTNTNYKVETKNKRYILRIPGKCTETMISRENEKYNSKLGYLLGLNVDTIYFNENNGVKITSYVDRAETLSPETAKLEVNMKLTTALLRKLHTSQVELKSTFNVFSELKKYETLIEDAKAPYYPGYEEARKEFFSFENKLQDIGLNILPCHNDLVAENFIKNDKRMYLIDWEYAGYNDPMWDLAAHLIECNFDATQEELYLNYYFEGREVSRENHQKILIYKILQDFLWSAWTIAKEASGEDFGTYGIERLNRAIKMIEEYKEIYEN